MGKQKKESFFWTSYSDLMTSLFFVMLVLFILTVAMLHKKIIYIEDTTKETKEINEQLKQQIAKGEQIEKSIEKIDERYFEYIPEYKRHTLKGVTASFRKGSSDISDLNSNDLNKLEQAGRAIRTFMEVAKDSIPEAEYMLIIEGQSSKDDWHIDDVRNNDVLSYRRAMALVNYWKSKGISFGNLPCDIIISGSGQSSSFRNQPDNEFNSSNQRFVIHIIPKPGSMSK